MIIFLKHNSGKMYVKMQLRKKKRKRIEFWILDNENLFRLKKNIVRKNEKNQLKEQKFKL